MNFEIASVAPSGLPRNDGKTSNFGFRNSKLIIMKRLISCLFVFLFVFISVTRVYPFSPSSSYEPEGKWSEHKSSHFIIFHHPSIPGSYIREFTNKCEKYYYEITERLGFNRFDFWLWEDRAKIVIYETKEKYAEESGRPEWSASAAHISKKIIFTYHFHEEFFDMLLPHELTHIILREMIGLKTEAPLWFDEGVAAANEKESYSRYLLFAKGFIKKEIYVPISELEMIKDGREIKSPSVFYATAASIIIFLLDEHKKRRFVEFCRELKDGTRFYEAMEKVYDIEDAEDLDEKFLTYLDKKSYKDIASNGIDSVKW